MIPGLGENVKAKPYIKFGLTPEQEQRLLDVAQKMFNGLREIRTEYESDWYELSKYFMPHLYRTDTDTSKTKRSKWSNIINNTCRTAVRTLQSGMQSGLTNPARPWAKIGIEDFDLMQYGPVREWCSTVTDRMLTVFRRTNMYNTSHQNYGVMATFGNCGRLQLADSENVMNFRNLMTGRYWVGLDNKGRKNRLFYIRYMTTVEMIAEFGYYAVSDDVRAAYDRSDYFSVKSVMCGIFPNPFHKWDRDGMALIAANQKPFVSVHWTEGYDKPLKTSGFDRFPAQVPSWEMTDDEAYGIGCGHDAIGDTKAIQLKEKEKAKGIQKMVSPPVNAPYEMRGGQFPIAGVPGGVTYRAPNVAPDALRSMYEVNLRLDYLAQDIRVDEERVNKAFFADLFLMMANMERSGVTATEIAERHEEKLLALGPVVENLGNEYLDPMIERAFEIMYDSNMLPPPPEEIQGMPLKVEYIGVLAQAQQQVGIGAIEKLLAFTGNMAALFPQEAQVIGDKINKQETIDEVALMLGVPSRIVRSDDECEKINEGRQQQMAAMQAQQSGMAAVQAAKTLGETPLGDSTALNRMVGL